MADVSKEKDSLAWAEVEPIYIELTKRMMEYNPKYTPLILEKLFTLDEAKVVRELPAPVDEIAKKLKLDKQSVEKTLKKLIKEGKILQTAKGPKPFSWLGQFGDILMANPAYDKEKGEEFYQLFGAWATDPECAEGHAKAYVDMSVGGKPINRVIPRWQAIKDIPGVMPCEDVREILRAYEGKLCNSRCVCRTFANSRHCAVHEGTIPSEGNCIHFGQMAEYLTEIMELTPYLSVEQVLENLDRLDRSPIYLMGPNDRDVKFICSCCDCCCGVAGAMKASKKYRLEDMLSPSRFLCTVDKGKCTGSKVCVTKCPFHAIEMENGKAHIDPDKCFGCGTCVINCPDEALKLKLARPPEHIPEHGAQLVDIEILEVREFPGRTEGGVVV